MPLNPGIGSPGGQQYPVLRSIQKFLQQMAEGGARTAATVIKELLQNADDAGATEVVVTLDERQEPDYLPSTYAELFAPALLVHNNAPFRIPQDCAPDEPDDFTAIRDVARGHKRAQATAAGRFGIGFNSVYFLTDTPLLFSRRAVHIFDLLHRVFDADGWAFSLDDFPANAASHAGPVKNVIDWCLPKAALGDTSFGSLAMGPGGDYQQTIFRLPLRRTPSGGSAIYDDRFLDTNDRFRLLREMVDEAARSILFLKHITSISFSVLRDREPGAVARIEVTVPPPEFATFLRQLQEFDRRDGPGPKCECHFRRTITCRRFEPPDGPSEMVRTFHVQHVARFDDDELFRLRERLRRNDERAVPWATVAIPLDLNACRLDGRGPTSWRVFLPLLEEGPSACVFSASLFIGPSRQRIEFRLNESDEGRRRTDWNRALAERALIPILQDLSAELPELAGELLVAHPREYLSLFPTVDDDAGQEPASGLTAFVRQRFSQGVWLLRLPDIWSDQFDVLVGEESSSLVLEMIPEWLLEYASRFRDLSTPQRRFVRYALGDAVAARVGRKGSVSIVRQTSLDVALLILRHTLPPRPRDLANLLLVVARTRHAPEVWEGTWAFASSDGEGLLRYSADTLYLLDDRAREHQALTALRALRLSFERVQWVLPDAGLATLASELRPRLDNIVEPTATAALELLRRAPNAHDQVTQPHRIKPVVDFLVGEPPARIPSDARLGFLVRTAHQKQDRRRLGVILLRPSGATVSDEDLWDVWFRRLFAEIDPPFASEINRLLSAHPSCIEMLHTRDCSVAVGRMSNALDILHSVRSREPLLYEQLQTEMNRASDKKPEARLHIASGLIEMAETQWDRLHPEQQYTVLALPIHRRPDGSFAGLIPAQDGDPAVVATAFRLQSDDDIEDAPVTIEACQLLQLANPTVRRFYRRRLGLEGHGRVAVLKDVLRQIGGAAPSVNHRMLPYLARYYESMLLRLEATGDEVDSADAQQLRVLLSSARTVPCLDGVWRRAGDCVAVWQVGTRLTEQGWSQERLAWVLGQLFHDEHIAVPDHSVQRLIQSLHDLREQDPQTIAKLAIASEGPALSLKDRVKLLRDNWRDRPEPGSAPSNAAGQLPLSVFAGQVPLADGELLDEQARSLPAGVLRLLAPAGVDLSRLTSELSLGVEQVRAVLKAFGVPQRSLEDLEARLTQRFAQVWPTLQGDERLALLRHVGERGLATGLREQASSLDTVLVASRPSSWQPPTQVLQPRWAVTQPPSLRPDRQPVLTDIAQTIHDVWDDWCGVRTFGEVFAVVLDAATASTDPRAASTAVYRWLDQTVSSPPTEEALGSLRDRAWVLAQRGDLLEFRRPAEVLVHPAERILVLRFWVPALPLPNFARHAPAELRFMEVPPATQETLDDLGECLSKRAGSDDEAAVDAYALVDQIRGRSEPLNDEWPRISTQRSVYRAFRREDRQVTSLELFIGDDDYTGDLSANLLCLRAGSALPRGLLNLYRRLGVPGRPTVVQVLSALASIESTAPNARASYGLLVSALEDLAGAASAAINDAWLRDVRVLSCLGTYEPVSRCYYDEDFGRRGRVSGPQTMRLIDTTDRHTQRLVAWLRGRGADLLVPLRAVAQLEPAEEPQPMELTPELSHLLLPWHHWLQEVVREGSALRDRLAELHLAPLRAPLRIVPVENIRTRLRLEDGQVIEQTARWEGPRALANATGNLFVRALTRRAGSQRDANEVGEVDAAIAREVAILIGGPSIIRNLKSYVDELLATLERPSTVLRRLRETYRQHFLHQYHDQVADPQFAELFEEYQRTVRSSKRAAELEERMYGLLADGFVRARRDQIRGYGYDEFSVFAELLQNAEDAYIQRARLGMDMPEKCDIAYRYFESADGARTLEVEHQGRPFNYWQHGAVQDRSLSRDVEGVLRSAGSFKPHFDEPDVRGRQPAVPTIGRFGLGFKSVYLLTDRPEIHSGAWHFAIEAGCLPEELPPPSDLQPDVTRIRLPLRAEVDTLQDALQLLGLMPFLRMISRLELRTPNSTTVLLDAASDLLIDQGAILVEQVAISSPALRQGVVRFLRCRSREHAGQLALLLAADGTPARWDEAFQYDLFAALPLRADLGCGIAASHHFEVQSGRTHLVDPKGNAYRIVDVAALLEGLIEGLRACASPNTPMSELLTRFWVLWRWERGDAECAPLRKELAGVLVGLAERTHIVPTLDSQSPTSLALGPLFFFSELPDAFREALVAAQVAIPVDGSSLTALTRTNVVADGFAGAYRRACECAGVSRATTLTRVGWDEVAAAFRERPWFAGDPGLLSCLAAAVNEDQLRKVAAWVSLCRVLGENSEGQATHLLPGELFAREFPGMQYLPTRLLRRISAAYDAAALGLLRRAGLRQRPSSDDIREWVLQAALTPTECVDILRYLEEDNRFRDYWDLKALFRSPWLPGKRHPINTVDAVELRLIPPEVLANEIFRAWLGLAGPAVDPSPEPVRSPPNPRAVLEDLSAWWQVHGPSWTARYEHRLYPAGHPPHVRDSFNPRDLGDRRQWITLVLLGTLHTMGRTQPEQHRDFLRRCDRKGWLDVFADAEHDARTWMQLLEEYLEDPTGTHDYYQWMKQFVVIFQVSRWLPEYVESFLNVQRITRPFALEDIVDPRTNVSFSGGGPDAPALTRALGMGACFVLRELTRLGLLRQPLAHRYCYVPWRRVCAVLEDLGCTPLRTLPPADRSSGIHRFAIEHLGSERATFRLAFDLPFLALADDPALQDTLLGRALPPDDDE